MPTSTGEEVEPGVRRGLPGTPQAGAMTHSTQPRPMVGSCLLYRTRLPSTHVLSPPFIRQESSETTTAMSSELKGLVSLAFLSGELAGGCL